LISDLSDGEKIIINEVGFICTELLNSNWYGYNLH
jgi:hypothetical protein